MYLLEPVDNRLGVTDKSRYNWVAKVKKSLSKNDEFEEIERLKQELKRVTEERDILFTVNPSPSSLVHSFRDDLKS